MICYCYDEKRENIERTYIFPWDEIIRRQSISIYKGIKSHYWYEKYIVDEKPYNDVYQEIKRKLEC